MGIFFDKEAVTFDQAPFATSASISIRDSLVTYLNTHGYSNIQLDALAPELLAYDGTSSRDTNITGKYVQGEALQGIPLLSTIGTQSVLSHNTVGSADAISLHSQALLAAFLQSDQTATTGKALDDATYKLPDLLKMIFDKTLYFNDSDANKENFLERLVKHEAGVRDPATGATTTAADTMLTRFTTDLWMIAQDGGLTLANANITDALIAFAMQKYYLETSTSTGFEKQLFGTTNVTGSIRFDFGDVATTLDDAKGYTQYLRSFIQDMADTNDGNRILSALPSAKDWYIQADTVKASVSHTLAANAHEWRSVA